MKTLNAFIPALKHDAAVRDYVLANITDPDGDALPEGATDKQKLDFFFDRFYSEFGYPENLRRYVGLQNTIKEYLFGLPLTVGYEFSYFEIEKLLRGWGYLKTEDSESKINNELGHYWVRLAGSLVLLGRKHGSTKEG